MHTRKATSPEQHCHSTERHGSQEHSQWYAAPGCRRYGEQIAVVGFGDEELASPEDDAGTVPASSPDRMLSSTCRVTWSCLCWWSKVKPS